jgi:hypothetical protein
MSVLEEEAPATKPDGVGIMAALAFRASVFALSTRGLLWIVVVGFSPHGSLLCAIGNLLAFSSRSVVMVCRRRRRLSAARYRRTKSRIFASREILGFLTRVTPERPSSSLPAAGFFRLITLPIVHRSLRSGKPSEPSIDWMF